MPEEEKEPSSITSDSQPPESSDSQELAIVKEQIQIKRLQRREKIQAINDWVTFVTVKTFGIASLIVGGLEIIVPSFLAITLTPPFSPFALLGIGLGLVTGKQSINIVKNVLDTINTDDTDE